MMNMQTLIAQQDAEITLKDKRIQAYDAKIAALLQPKYITMVVLLLGSLAGGTLTVYVARDKLEPKPAAWSAFGVLLAQPLFLYLIKRAYTAYKDYNRRRVAHGP